jgi:hypothetical protein
MDTMRVGAFHTRAEAEAARGYLVSQGIDARVVGDDMHGLHPDVAFGTARVTLLVPTVEAEEARRLLDEHEVREPGDRTATRRSVTVWFVAALMLAIVVISILATGRFW